MFGPMFSVLWCFDGFVVNVLYFLCAFTFVTVLQLPPLNAFILNLVVLEKRENCDAYTLCPAVSLGYSHSI